MIVPTLKMRKLRQSRVNDLPKVTVRVSRWWIQDSDLGQHLGQHSWPLHCTASIIFLPLTCQWWTFGLLPTFFLLQCYIYIFRGIWSTALSKPIQQQNSYHSNKFNFFSASWQQLQKHLKGHFINSLLHLSLVWTSMGSSLTCPVHLPSADFFNVSICLHTAQKVS